MMLDATLVLGPYSKLRGAVLDVAVRHSRRLLTVAVAFLCLLTASTIQAKAETHTSARPSSKVSKSTKSGKLHRTKSKKRASWKHRGQKEIDDQRCRAIQEALIREKYLDGEPTGRWDDQSKAAMVKYQQDNGWQTKVVPDSRAIIKLGLGPSNEGLINPDTAATAMSSASALPAEKAANEAGGRSVGSH